ncbi:MAG: ribonuclease H-like domain-containing protein [Acidobacteriota bacterium]
MLKNTFRHLPNCSAAKEQKLWAAGITSWEALLQSDPQKLSRQHGTLYAQSIEESFKQLEYNNPNYFADLLSSKEHWRFFPDFRHSIAYLDIETTGLNYGDTITTIALYDGSRIFYYIKGENLNDFMRDIERYSLIVTYNGKCFDVPFIERYFKIKIPHAHIDLMYVLRSLGYRGGLKGCERQLGLQRGELDGVDGFFAVLLWKDYQKNKNPKSLETLLAYNIQDVVNLETLLTIAYNKKISETPFAERNLLPRPQDPQVPFHADEATIKRLQHQKAFSWSYGWR